MKTDPNFSVIIPVYNRERFIERSVESVLNQQYQDFEVICINNGSTDQTLDLLQKLAKKDDRVRVFDQENKGRCAARNKGLDEARGEWICFLDSDDFYFDMHLAAFEYQQRKHPYEKAFASTLVHQNKLTARNKVNRLEGKPLLLRRFIRGNPISLIQLCLHHSLVKDLRFHEDDLPMAEDWLFIREIALRTSIWKFNQETVEVGEHDERSMNTMDMDRIAYYNIKSAKLFVERNKLGRHLRNEVLGRAYMLATHIYLKAGNKKNAWKALRASIRYPLNWLRHNLYWALIKMILP